MNKAQRCARANEFIKVIANCGRRFFYFGPKDRYGHFFIGHDGHLRWRDEYTNKAIYLSGNGNWHRGFSNGGTLKDVIRMFAHYIRKNRPVNLHQFRIDGPWGYGEAMAQVVDAARRMFSINKGSNGMPSVSIGDQVNYHSIIGGPITSTDHELQAVSFAPNNFGSDVGWITGKSGCVALAALSVNKGPSPEGK